MTAMTDVPVANGATWVLAYTAGGAVTVTVHCRHPSAGLLMRVNGSSGATSDDANAAAEQINPFASASITLANGDKIFLRSLSSVDSRATIRA